MTNWPERPVPDAFRSEFWAAPDWLSDGDFVWLPLGESEVSGKMVVRVTRCTVVVAAGNHARIQCKPRGIDRWVSLASLLVKPDDPRHPNARGKWIEEAFAKASQSTEEP